MRTLDDALARLIPESTKWKREILPPHPKVRGDVTYYIEVTSPVRPKEQKLVVHLRYDGDVQIEYWVAENQSFEAHFPLPVEQEKCVIEHIAQFVAEIVAKKIVLSYWKGIFKGGRRFLEAESLEKLDRRKLSWVTSWHGTFDWRSNSK